MGCNNIKNVKLNLAISQDAACAILDSLARAAITNPSVYDNNVLVDYLNKQELLDNYPEGDFGVVIANHMSKLQAAYDCCTVALEVYEALEASREQKSNEEPAPEIEVAEVSTQVANEEPAPEIEMAEISHDQKSNEKPAPESKVPEGSRKVLFRIYTLTCYQPDAEASIIWSRDKGGYASYANGKGFCSFDTRQGLMDYIIRILTPEHSLKEYTESNEYTVEEKELALSVTRKLLADLGVPDSEDYSGTISWECVNA